MEYQNLFTTVTVTGPVHDGVPLGPGNSPRSGKPFLSYWAGKLGNAQIGPIYLGGLGLASLILGTLAINIIGFNMLAQVGWDPVQFVRQLFWLALEPPAPAYGLSIPPMNQGGWYLLASFFFLASVLTWWARLYRRARELGSAEIGLEDPRVVGAAGPRRTAVAQARVAQDLLDHQFRPAIGVGRRQRHVLGDRDGVVRPRAVDHRR